MRVIGLVVTLALTLGLPLGEAQQPAKVSRIGVLVTLPRPAPASPHPYNAFLQELRNLGYVEGQNVIIEWRHTEGNPERRRREAATLVTWKPDVVFTPGAADTRALHEVDASIPIVAAAEGDFVVSGLADNLARPGGNVTGLQTFSIDLAAKRLEILKELMPRVQRVAVLQETPRTETARLALTTRLDALDTAAKRLSVRVGRFEVASEHAVDRVFADIKRNSDAVMVVASQFTVAHRPRITQLAIRHRLPSMHDYSVFVEAGGLASYGPKFPDLYRRAAQFVDRILKGAKPADLPIEQPTKFELVINLKTAKALGLTIPQSVLLRADQVIE